MLQSYLWFRYTHPKSFNRWELSVGWATRISLHATETEFHRIVLSEYRNPRWFPWFVVTGFSVTLLHILLRAFHKRARGKCNASLCKHPEHRFSSVWRITWYGWLFSLVLLTLIVFEVLLKWWKFAPLTSHGYEPIYVVWPQSLSWRVVGSIMQF